MKKIFSLLIFCFVIFVASAQKQVYLLVGTYTGGASKGIHVYRFNDRNGTATLVDSAVTDNPSYIATSPDQRFVYAVNELGNDMGGGKVTAFRFNKTTGHLTVLNQQSVEGEHPCYVTVDKSNKWVIAGNYTGGNVTVLPIVKGGELGAATTTVQHYGSGINPRQEKPHVHATVLSADNRFLYVPDLGKDKLMIYSFNAKTGSLTLKDTTLKLTPGSGPRHFVFHPNNKWAYLIQELTGNVTVFSTNNGKLKVVQTISSLPTTFTKSFTGADIHVSPDGRFLYTSIRDSANTLAIFSINKINGQLRLLGHQPVLGKTPRNFNLDPSGKFLLVANQNSDEIVVFNVSKETGSLTDSGKRIGVGNPVCIKWITK